MGAGLHDDPSSAKDKSDLGLRIGNSYASWQGQCDTHADSSTLNSRNCRLGTVMNCKSRPSTAMICQFTLSHGFISYPSRWSMSRSVFGLRTMPFSSFTPGKPISRSAPAQKLLPAPVKTTTLTLGSMSTSSYTRSKSSRMISVKALSFCGLFSVITITGVTLGDDCGTLETLIWRRGREL